MESERIRVGLVVPHLFIHRDIMPQVIFSPGRLALALAEGLAASGVEVTLFTPGPADTAVRNVTADLRPFEAELVARGDDFISLLKKHPLVWVSLARQVQAELVARAFAVANAGELDLVHIYTNEEDIALPFAQFCSKPVLFTHHDPFDFLVKYRRNFPKYPYLNWISISMAQRRGMPAGTNWVGNIYHGVDGAVFRPVRRPAGDYALYVGRVIQPKGVHLAIAAVKQFNRLHPERKLKLKIVGKHYAGAKDAYWQNRIEPELGGDIEYVGFVRDDERKRDLLANAAALVIPSIFEEPFGMVMIEALACGTPVIGLDSGAVPEVVRDGVTGFVVPKLSGDEAATAVGLAEALGRVDEIDRQACKDDFEGRFTIERMVREHLELYERVIVPQEMQTSNI